MKKTKLLSIALSVAVLPMSLMSCSNDKLQGFDIDLATEMGKELGVKVKFQEIIWEQKEFELNSKNIDLIWNGFTITEERKQELDFSLPYMENKQVIVSKKNFSSIDENQKYKVSAEEGSAGSDVFSLSKLFSKSEQIETVDQITALTEVLSGTSDLAIIDSVMAGYYLKSTTSYGNDLKILEDYKFDSEYYGIGFRKNSSGFVAKINEGLTKCYEKGKTKEIAEKYGLDGEIVKPSTYTSFADVSDQSSWNYIKDKGTIVIGYTVFAPIAFSK